MPSSAAPFTSSQNPEQIVRALADRLRRALSDGESPRSISREISAELLNAGADRWLICARACIVAGIPSLAANLLEEALRRWPQDELRYWLGNALRLSGRKAEAEAALRKVLAAQAGHEGAALSLAFMLRDAGRIEAACAVVIGLHRAQGGVDSALRAGAFLEECKRPQFALEIYERQLARHPQHLRLLAAAGDVAMVLGQFEQGRSRLLAALDAGFDPENLAGIWLMLANSQRYADPEHSDFARFRQVWRDPQRSVSTRVAAGFALGKALADVGDFAGSAQILIQANAMHRREHSWDAAAWKEFVARQLTRSVPQVAAPRVPFVPVFVVGLPRTGTTLIEERLVRHPQVRGRGEMNWLPFLLAELEKKNALENPAALQRAAAIYLAHLREDDSPARWYIDKNPHNFRFLGLIAALFPQAKVIHCVRDRRDTALSIWSQHFAHQDVAYAYDFRDIAAFAVGHDRLMDHWRRELRLPIYVLQYERLVASPEQVLGEVGEFLGLPAADPAATQHKEPGAILTASLWQARQPVYQHSIGRWRRYERFLPELGTCFQSESESASDPAGQRG